MSELASYKFIREKGRKYLYRSPYAKSEWDLAVDESQVEMYVGDGLPPPPSRETAVPGDKTP